eukprot:TRINITY_DN11381_c0_g4_i1.p1 TRINITY_DN11381_c0_g4~~TRINITY_DN11381_c0_g4_i1.p1  ORF type:complete len:161 (-),score=8.49 TRINITY_DN11381_c0_g4_i1:89-571(-)
MKESINSPSFCILSLYRVKNKVLQVDFDHARKKMEQKNGGDANIKQLFHGTRDSKPEDIYAGHYGFDFRLSQPGLWGRGSYFATNARYSLDYAHTSSSGSKWIFLADVILGEVYHCAQNRNLIMPPDHYDSVSGLANESLNYVVYEHQRSYPKYLIEYSI